MEMGFVDFCGEENNLGKGGALFSKEARPRWLPTYLHFLFEYVVTWRRSKIEGCIDEREN